MKFGLDIGGTKVAGAVIDAEGATLATARRDNPPDYAGTLAAVSAVVAEMADALGVAPQRVGVCVSGNVRQDTGTVLLGTLRWIQDKPFRDDMAKALGAPVRLANDADCFALSEASDGAAQGARSVFGVILGTGVGGGFVVNGGLVTGARGVAGEWGHIPLPRATPRELEAGPCSCGRHGCIETMLSGTGLAAEFQRETGRRVANARAVVDLAEAGDPEASAAMDLYEERLGRALAMVMNLIEPDAFVFGGGLSNVARIYDGARRAMAPHVFGGVVTSRLLRNRHGDSSGVRGAARLWDEDLREATP
jgi:fructokinase